MVNFFYRLPAVFVSIILVISQFPTTVAQTELQICEPLKNLAMQRTVKILGQYRRPIQEGAELEEFEVAGSGVIIAKENSNQAYYVLTAKHTVAVAAQDKVVTFDGREHFITSVKNLQGLDLSVLEFLSAKSYDVADLGDSNPEQLHKNSRICIAGWSKSDSLFIKFAEGILVDNTSETEDGGYNLVYRDANTENGMSGGPIFNKQGRLVGIHGQDELYQKGIGINTFLQVAPPIVKSLLRIPITQPPTLSPAPTTIDVPTAERGTSSAVRISANQTIRRAKNFGGDG